MSSKSIDKSQVFLERMKMFSRFMYWFLGTSLLLFSLVTSAATSSIDAVTFTVSNASLSSEFYIHALGFEKVSDHTSDDASLARLYGIENAKVRTIELKLGHETLDLQQFLNKKTGRPIPPDAVSEDLIFQHFAIIVSDMDKAYGLLKPYLNLGKGSISVGGPQHLPPNTGSVTAFKFRDPDGHPVELLFLPDGVGREVWHGGPTKSPFLGIDHSAIGISNTEKSKEFYFGLLGFKQVGYSLNQGAEQERLDGAFEAVVNITPIRPTGPDGPGIEFLEYLTPAGGHPAPVDSKSTDLWHVHLTLEVTDLSGLADALRKARVQFISSGVVEVQGQSFSKGLMVRDPDGHNILLTEK